jgi:hypothetical protein
MAEPGDGGIARKFFDNPSVPPNDTRPEPGEPIRRSSREFGNSGHASPLHNLVQGHGQDRNPRLNKQGAETPTHAQDNKPRAR